jgi:hypothetical protein
VNSATLWTSLGNSQVDPPRFIYMRWDNLFDDLESQLNAELGNERADASHDAERARRAEQTLSAEIAQECSEQAVRGTITLWIDGVALWITVDNFGSDWISGEVTAPIRLAGYSIVNLSCVEAFELPRRDTEKLSSKLTLTQRSSGVDSKSLPGIRMRRLGNITFRIVMRDLSRRRKRGFLRSSGREISGTIDRVGRDYVEVTSSTGTQANPVKCESIRHIIPLHAVTLFRLEE